METDSDQSLRVSQVSRDGSSALAQDWLDDAGRRDGDPGADEEISWKAYVSALGRVNGQAGFDRLGLFRAGWIGRLSLEVRKRFRDRGHELS